MKLLLINASGKEIKMEPLGLEYLVSSLELSGIEVILVDATIEGLSEEEFVSKLHKIDPDVIGISMTTMGLMQDLKGLSLAKKACPDAKIVVGGPHPSAAPIELMKSAKDIDFAVIGEGEITLVELVKTLENDKGLKNVNGIAFRENGNIKLTQPREQIKNLDSIPIPSRDFIDFRKVKASIPFGRRNPFSIMMTSRGCPFKCIFCSKSVFGNKYRYRSVENVVEEIEYLLSLGIKEIRFYDDIFTLNQKRTMKLCEELIKGNFDLIWSCEGRVDTVSRDLLEKMKKAGCYHISYGVESGSQKILDIAKKGIKVSQARDAFKITKEVGLEASAFFMFGLPGETKKTLKETLSLMKNIKADFVSVSPVWIPPDTKLFKIAKEDKIIENINWRNFEDVKLSPLTIGSPPQYIPKDLTKEELTSFVRRFYMWYYLHPLRAYRRLKLLTKNPDILFRGGKALFSYVLRR